MFDDRIFIHVGNKKANMAKGDHSITCFFPGEVVFGGRSLHGFFVKDEKPNSSSSTLDSIVDCITDGVLLCDILSMGYFVCVAFCPDILSMRHFAL